MSPSQELRQKLAKIEGWKFYRSRSIQRKFRLKDFADAIKFMNKIARMAEKSGHYPDITVQNFSEVVVRTITPSVEEVTSKDLELAKKINREYDIVKYDEHR